MPDDFLKGIRGGLERFAGEIAANAEEVWRSGRAGEPGQTCYVGQYEGRLVAVFTANSAEGEALSELFWHSDGTTFYAHVKEVIGPRGMVTWQPPTGRSPF